MFSSLRALGVLRGQNSYFSLRLRGARTFVVRRMEKRSSTDARQLFAEQHIDNTCAADTRFHQHHSGVITDNFSDDLSDTPERMLAHLSEDSGSRVRWHDRQKFTLVSHVEGIQPENLAGSFDGLAHRDL